MRPPAAKRDAKAHKKATRPTRVGTDAARTLAFRCGQCLASNGTDTKAWHAAAAFAPNTHHAKSHTAFHGALEARRLAVLAGASENDREVQDNTARMRAHAALQCQRCRENATASQANPATLWAQCVAEWARMRAAPDAVCRHCGTTRALEANHRANFSERAKAHAAMVKTHGRAAADAHHPPEWRKLGMLSQPSHWASERAGGVEAMRRELAKCEWLCACCHRLDACSDTAPKNASDSAKVKRDVYAAHRNFLNARNSARIRQQKRAYVNALKREAGYCERLDCPEDGPNDGACDAGFEACFDWDHQDEVRKTTAVANLVNNAQSFETAKPAIDAEVRKCRLLCCNCHKTKPQWLAAAPAGYKHYCDPHRPLDV